MSSVLKVDQIQSDTGTVNVSSNLQFSGSSSTLQVGKALYLANTNNFALQFQDDVAGRLRIASSYSTFGDNNPFIIERPSSASAQNDAITIRSGGVVDLGKGQLKFPASQNASSDPNTLDDYEEGTWTPALSSEGGTLSVTYTSREGTYTKIGNLVTVRFQMRVSAHSGGSGQYRISGLPFTAQNPGNDHIGVSTLAYENHPIGSGQQLIAVIDDNTTLIRFLHSVNNAGWTTYAPGSSCGQYGSFTYAI